jgi:toxin ParE1/3/4
MAQIRWTAEAESWLREIFDYIAADNPAAAIDTVEG